MVFVVTMGCGSEAKPSPTKVARSRTSEPSALVDEQLLAIPGRVLVAPLVRKPVAAPTVTLEDRPLRARVVQLRATLSGERDAWLGPQAEWSVKPLDSKPGVAPELDDASWALLIDMPEQRAGEALNIDGVVCPIAWTEDPSAPRLPSLPPIDGTSAQCAALRAMLVPRLADPLERWRARMTLARLTADDDAVPHAPAPQHPALEDLADQEDDRWRLALARLERADPPLARLVLSALAGVAMVPAWNEVVSPSAGDEKQPPLLLPTWVTGPAAYELRADLLEPRLEPAARADRARTWLARMPRAAVWLIDEQGASGVPTAGRVSATLALTECHGLAGTAALSAPASGVIPTDLRANQTVVLRPSLPIEADRPLCIVPLTVGSWNTTLTLLTGPMVVQPSGPTLGPWLDSWTMASWMTVTPTPAMPLTSARVAATAQGDGWELLIACADLPEAEALGKPADDFVKIWFGRLGSPRLIVQLSPANGAEVLAPRGRDAPQNAIWRDGSGWSARLVIPANAMESGGRLLIGLSRLVGGARSSWPRPMMPHQPEPGRALLDLSRWEGLGAE